MGNIVNHVLDALAGLGAWGIMLGLMVEVLPSEIVLAYGGFLISQGHIGSNPLSGFFEALLFGIVGGTLAQIFLYWIGRYGGRPFLEKYGKYIFIHKKHIDVAEQWFQRYGNGIVFTARFVPVLRQAISIPAGMARMKLWVFTFYTVLAMIPWAILFLYLGYTLGANWRNFHELAAPYVKPAAALAVVLMAAYIAFKWQASRRAKAQKVYGEAGEKAVAHELKFLEGEYRVYHGRVLHAGHAHQEIDHLVVGPNGVFHIETKHWSGQIRFTEQGVERSGSDETGASPHAADPTAQLYRHEFVVKEMLRELKIDADVVGVLCFSHPGGHIHGKSPAFATVKLDRLTHTIRAHHAKKPLSPKDVRRIDAYVSQHGKPHGGKH